MLISENVIMRWSNKTKEYYINKGYNFTKINEQFEVKVNDLSPKSRVKVLVKCDCVDCKNPNLNPKWCNYTRYVKEDGKYYCNKCSMKLFGREKIYKNQLSKSKSFELWCLENNQLKLLNRWDYELNNCNPSEVCYSTNKKFYFKCPRGIHKSELKKINSIASGYLGMGDCKVCKSFAQWGIDNICSDFLEKYWDYEKNVNINPWIISSGFEGHKVWIKCQEKDYHGSYEARCSDFKNNKNWCPYCCNFHGKVHPLDSLGTLHPQVLEIWSDKNEKSPYEYTPMSNQEVWLKCLNKVHEDYYRKISSSNLSNFRCPICSSETEESFLQEKVRLYLNSMSYIILHEKYCTISPSNPKKKGTNNLFKYDNEIKELKLIIEVHGQQHYKLTGFHNLSAKKNNSTPEKELHYQKLKDRYKRIYAKSMGYEYLEIPYWTDDKDETWKELINNKINYILNERLVI